MARKSAATPRADHNGRKRTTRGDSASRSAADTTSDTQRSRSASSGASTAIPDLGDIATMAKAMTPDQALELYKANAGLALEVINAAIEGAGQLRRKQFEGEEEARDFQRRHARSAAEARDPQALVAAGQGAAQEAMERSMRYWSEMFDLIVEIQKRLFTLMEEQMEAMPGVRETRAAMGMLPDVSQMQKIVSAMQAVVSSGESTFASMQRVMGDFAKLGQGSVQQGGAR